MPGNRAGASHQPDPLRPLSMAQRLGIPPLRGRWPVLIAIALDTLGAGLLLPISLLYFAIVTDESITRLGLLLSLAMFLALPTGLLGGGLVDRFGAKRVMVVNNLCAAAGYVGYYVVSNETVIFAGMFLVAVGECMFWSCWLPYVKGLAAEDGFDTWFAFIEATKAGCLVLGAGLTTLFLAAAGNNSVRILVLLNIATCLIAAVIVGRHPVSAAPATDFQRHAGWGSILRDPRYTLMAVGQLLSTPIGLLGGLALPVFFARDWRLPTWTGPAMFALSNVMTLVLQPPVTRLVRPVPPSKLLAATAVLCVVSMALLFTFTGGAGPGTQIGMAVAVASTVVLTIAGILYFPTTNATLMASVTDHNAGRVSALFHTGTSVSAALSPGIVGVLLNMPAFLWTIMAGLNVAGIVCFELALRVRPRTADPIPEPAAKK